MTCIGPLFKSENMDLLVMKIKPALPFLLLFLPLICAADNLAPEVLSVTILDNEDSEECAISGPTSAFIEYDLKDERYANLLIQVMYENDVIYDTSFSLYGALLLNSERRHACPIVLDS